MGRFVRGACLAAGILFILFTGCVVFWFGRVLEGAFGIGGRSCSRVGSVCIYFSVVGGLADFLGCYFSNLMPISSGCFHTVII